MSYAELLQKVRDYTEVDSNVLTSTIVDGFIEMLNLEYLEKLIMIMQENMQHLILLQVTDMYYYLLILKL
jgi:hypothetical protein